MIGGDPNAYAFEEDGQRVPAVEFDFAAIEQVTASDLSELSQADVDRAIALMRLLLGWVWQNGMKNPDGLKIRAIIICWIFLKELRPLTMTQMANGFGLHKQSLDRWVQDFKRAIKIRTPHMRTFDNESA